MAVVYTEKPKYLLLKVNINLNIVHSLFMLNHKVKIQKVSFQQMVYRDKDRICLLVFVQIQ